MYLSSLFLIFRCFVNLQSLVADDTSATRPLTNSGTRWYVHLYILIRIVNIFPRTRAENLEARYLKYIRWKLEQIREEGGRGEVVSRSYLASSSSFNGENRYIPFLSLNPSLPLPMLLSSCIKHAGTIVWGGKRKWRNGKQIQRWMVANDGIFQGSPRFVFVPFQLEANRRATLKVPTNHPASQRTCFHLLRKLKGNLTPRTKSIWDTEILIAAKELRSIIVYFLPLRVR